MGEKRKKKDLFCTVEDNLGPERLNYMISKSIMASRGALSSCRGGDSEAGAPLSEN